ncbi:MAG: VanZ family protein [Burkholderiaceae bacterium]|nr:MAG: VanZ family protein [Burkholderiaceae bacterium]
MALGYAFFIVYGSLLPFDWNGLALAGAWENFQHIRFLKLGVGDRADWVANLLLYIPLGFLLCGGLVGKSRRPLVVLIGLVLSWLSSAGLALGVEFLQEFFPPRTVSLNDILAEFIGAAVGMLLWPVIGLRLADGVRIILRGGANTTYAVLCAYALVYGAMILFPYDFLLSYDEWQARLAPDKMGWLFVAHCGGSCFLRLIPEALTIIPLGMLGALACGKTRRVSLLWAAAAGLLSGILIEILQLTIATGISQGASAGAKALGVLLGVWLIQLIGRFDWRWARSYTKAMLALGTVPYLLALAWLNHWLDGPWTEPAKGWERLAEMRFLPFYYHYFTTETVALLSLLFQAGIYFPVGVGLWFWRWTEAANPPERALVWPALAAGILASVVETGKLFIAHTHADPTNIWIAAVAASAAYALLDLMFGIASHSAGRIQSARDSSSVMGQPSGWALLGGAALLAGLGAALSSPLGGGWVFLSSLAYAALLWRYPGSWMVWVLALLPLLDLTPWSGRLFWTEYDTLLLLTLGVGYLRLYRGANAPPALRWPAKLLLTLLALSTAISLGIGLLPLGILDQNAFASYTSPYNALRVSKGLLLALAFIPLLRAAWSEPASAARRLALGMLLGLSGEILYVLWERVTFSGLFNFQTDYRITGSFPAMHVGGAYIECYLAVTLPFVVLWAWQQRRVWAALLAAGLYGLGAYCVMVTFSRGGQAAFSLTTLVLLFGFVRLSLQDRVRRVSGVTAVVLIASVAVAIAWPVFNGKYSQARVATTRQDIVTRTNHWADAQNIIHSRNAAIFGVGLGSFPSAYFWGSRESTRPATYTFVTQNGNTFLRLASGETLYFEQPVALVPEHRYTLSMDLRGNADNAAVTIPVCEKALLYSFTCVWTTRQVGAPAGQWRHHEIEILTRDFGTSSRMFPRPAKLSLYNGQAGTLVEIDNISLRDAAGNNLVRNGDFSDGMHHWFFSTDNHLAWHVKNLYLHVFFEQGWFGLIGFLALITYALARWLSRAWNHEPLSLVLCASFLSFLVVGLVDSLIDETRIGFLFYFLLLAGLMADAALLQRPKTPVNV